MLAFFRNGCLLRLHSLRPFSNHRLPFSTFPRRNESTLRETVQSIVSGFNGSREMFIFAGSIAGIVGAIVASFVGVFGLHLQLRSEIKADVNKVQSEIKKDVEAVKANVDAVKGEIKQDLGKVEKQIDQLIKVWSGKVEAQDKMIVGQDKVIEGQDRKIESLFSRN